MSDHTKRLAVCSSPRSTGSQPVIVTFAARNLSHDLDAGHDRDNGESRKHWTCIRYCACRQLCRRTFDRLSADRLKRGVEPLVGVMRCM